MPRFRMLVSLAVLSAPAWATTLQQLSLDSIIAKSTAIVRGKAQAQPNATAARGAIIYSHFRIQVSEVWKGPPVSQIDVAVPGGFLDGKQQTYAGSPVFANGQEYLFFLWTSRTGLTQVIGLSQGLFNITPDSAGTVTVTRDAAPVRMLSPSGQEVTETSFKMPLADFKQKVASTLADRSKQ